MSIISSMRAENAEKKAREAIEEAKEAGYSEDFIAGVEFVYSHLMKNGVFSE